MPRAMPVVLSVQMPRAMPVVLSVRRLSATAAAVLYSSTRNMYVEVSVLVRYIVSQVLYSSRNKI